MKTKFPIEQWFDASQKIDKVAADLTEAQLVLDAVKRNLDPAGADAHKEYRDMRRAVDNHNKKFG